MCEGEVHPFAELTEHGLLWLINTTVFHPRGMALVVHTDGDGVALGWSIRGNGTEVFTFDDATAERQFQAFREMIEALG